MIAAGVVDTKIFGVSRNPNLRPGICFLTSAKFASTGSAEKEDGSGPAAVHGPLTSAAVIQPPLLSRYHCFVVVSVNTSQLVFTANDSVVPETGASTGSPSKTTRLAGRSLTKMRGGELSSAASGGFSACLRKLMTSVASGTCFTPMLA